MAKRRSARRPPTPRVYVQPPTVEREAKAGQFVRRDAMGRCHVEDSPLDRLAARHVLARDPCANRMLHAAGQRYFEHWYLSGMLLLGAQDVSRPYASGAGGSSCGMPASERAAYHRQQYRAAVQALGAWFLAAVDPIVLAEQDPASVGARISGYSHHGLAVAVALDRLRGGLDLLAVHFRIKRLDMSALTMADAKHDPLERPEEPTLRALLRHRPLAGM